MQEWESPEFARKNKHLTSLKVWRHASISAKFDHPLENHGMPVSALQTKNWINKVEVKSLPRLSKRYAIMSKFDSKLFGSNKHQNEKSSFWWMIENMALFPNHSAPIDQRVWSFRQFKWWLRIQETDDPIAIGPASAQPPISCSFARHLVGKMTIWNAHWLMILDHLRICGAFWGRSLFKKKTTLQFCFFPMFPAASRKVGGTCPALLDNLQFIFGQGLQVWNREDNSHQSHWALVGLI